MKTVNFSLVKLEADEGKVFDYKNAKDEHLYSKVIFLGVNDSADNYIEVEEPIKE